MKLSLNPAIGILVLSLAASLVVRATPGFGTDVAIGKSASTTSALVGDTVVFTIGLTNFGSNTVNNLTGSDILPKGFSFFEWSSSGSPASPVYDPTNGGWTVAAIAAGVADVLTISTTATNAGTYTNTALIMSTGNTNNNSSSVVVTLTPQTADLMVSKTAELYGGPLTNEFQPGDLVEFTVTIANLGPGTAYNIAGSDMLPAGFVFSGWANGSSEFYYPQYESTNGVWTLYELPPGDWGSFTIYAFASGLGTFTNTAAITSAIDTDPNPGNNSASVVVAVTQPAADLQVIKTVSTNTAKLYQAFNFYVVVTNVGPVAVSNVVVTDMFPAGLVQTYWVGYGGINQNYTPSNGVWTITNLAPGQGYLLSIGAAGAAAGNFTNVAQLTSSTPADSNAANNTGSAMITILPLQADLAVTKTVFTNTLPVFSTFAFNFQLTVTNLGPDTVSNLTVTDLLPPGLAFGGALNNPGSSYAPSNGLWSFSVPLAAGQGATMTLVTAAPQIPGTFTNFIKVNIPSGVTDPNLSNNTASAIVNVLPVYRILGYVANCSSNGVPLANVTLTLTGAANQTTTTFGIGNGNYSFNSVSNGTYTITPSQPGNVFVPASAPVTVSNAWVTVPPFVGGIGLIYGQVTYFGSPVANHPVTLSGGALRKPSLVFTDGSGYYIFTNTPVGNYTVTAVATNGYVFTPTNPAVVLNAANCAAITNFTATVPRSVQLVALEVVQVIQDWSNSVPLIQGKETYVRAHFQLTNNNPVLLQGAQLISAGPALTPLPSSTLLVKWTNAAARPIREQLANSLLFRLPADWLAGTVNLQFVCTNNVTVVPTNVVPANSTVTVTFIPAAPLPVKIYPVHWTDAAGTEQQISAANLADVPRRLLSMYPVPSVDAEPAPPLIMTANIPPPYTNVNARLAANRLLDWLSGFTFRAGFPPPNKRIYHGAVAGATVESWNRMDSGLADTTRFVSSGLMPPNDDFYVQIYLRHLATHEIGHNLGRPHTVSAALFGTFINGSGMLVARGTPACSAIQGPPNVAYPLFQTVAGLYVNKPALGPMNSGTNSLIYGFDTLTYRAAQPYNPLASPYVYFDVMSYCGVQPALPAMPLSWWISTYTYTNLYNYVTNNFAGPFGGGPGPGPGTNWMIFRGLVDYDQNSAEFLPTLSVTTSILPPSPPPGTYSLVLFDSNSNILADIPFQPSIDEPENGDVDTGAFMIPVEATAGIHEAAIWDGTNFIADLIGSTNLPYVASVALTSTNGGSYTGSGQLNISWLGGDPNPDTVLTYNIEYSPDGGATWETLAVDWPYPSYSLDSQVMPASAQGLIRVIASDGLDSSTPVAGNSFTVLPHPPTILLNAPMNGTIFIADEQIFLDASVYDSQDGPLDGSSVQWVSSLDGFLGDGAVLNFEANALSEGTHIITVTATDSAGLSSSASVEIYVLSAPPPQLSIDLNDSGQAEITWLSSATNYVLQATTDLLSGNWMTVTNAPAAANAIQTVTVPLTPTPSFFRLQHQ